MEDSCKNCPDIQLDDYGYLCDVACGKRTAWLNYQAGMKEAVEWYEEPHACIHKIGYWLGKNGECDICRQVFLKSKGIEK